MLVNHGVECILIIVNWTIKYFLILIDAYSKFIDVHFSPSMTSFVTIELLRKSFANFGILSTIVSDNAPNLVSNELREFYLKNGIDLINPSPCGPLCVVVSALTSHVRGAGFDSRPG